MGFAERLQELINEHRSANAFAHHVGIGQSLLRKYLGGGNPGLDKVIQIARATGVSIDWLAAGEGPRDSRSETSHVPMRTEQEQRSSSMQMVKPEDLEGVSLVLVPRLDVQASAGTGLIAISEDVVGMLALEESFLRGLGVNPKAAHSTTARGDSMFPTIRDGDLMIIDTSIDQVVDEGIYNVVFAGRVLVKRLQITRDGSLILRSDNRDAGYRDEVVEAKDVPDLHVVGRVMWNGRRM